MKKLIFILFIFTSCQDPITERFTLDIIEPSYTIQIPVDSLTDYKAIYPQYLDNLNTLLVLNYINNRLDRYDLNFNTSNSLINFNDDINYGEITGYEYVNKDSIFFLNNRNELILANLQGDIFYKIKIKSSEVLGAPQLDPVFLKLINDNKNISIANYFSISKKSPSHVSFSGLANGNLEFKGGFPIEYIEGFYGYKDYGNWNYAQSNSYIYVNFPNLNSIYKYNKKFEFQDIIEIDPNYIKPIVKLFKNTLSDLDLKIRPSENEVSRIESQYLNNFIFPYLIYNKHTNHYYRIIGYPISKYTQELKDPKKSIIRNYSVLVLSESFEVLGEFGIEWDKYLIEYGSIFPTKDGLAIQKEELENEDKMNFDVFVF